jgi:hypothetical protein
MIIESITIHIFRRLRRAFVQDFAPFEQGGELFFRRLPHS